MPVSNYLCINGEFIKDTDACQGYGTRAFRYGDVLHENIHAWSTEPQFLEEHFERLVKNMHLLAMQIPAGFSVFNLRELIIRLLNKNRIFKGATIRLHVYRRDGDSHIAGRPADFILESSANAGNLYDLNEKGLVIDVCTGYTRTSEKLAPLYEANSIFFLLAGMEAVEQGMDDLVLMNSAGRIVETTRSNIFLVSGNAIFTPSLSLGCIPGIMRKIIIDLATNAGYRINDQCMLTDGALNDAEEIFLTDSLRGIQWVGAYKQVRYFKKTSHLLSARLKEKARGNVF